MIFEFSLAKTATQQAEAVFNKFEAPETKTTQG